jgi:hypothetical protein
LAAGQNVTCTFTNKQQIQSGALTIGYWQNMNGQDITTASLSNSGGSVWYGQIKATQELTKDTFDAIDNRVAYP